MKKLLLFVAVAVSMAGCVLIDNEATIDHVVDNQTTGTEIISTNENYIDVTVLPGEKKVGNSIEIRWAGGKGFHSAYSPNPDDRVMLVKWSVDEKGYEWMVQYKFVEYSGRINYHYTYTLTVTDELLAEVTAEDSEVRLAGMLVETEVAAEL